MHINNYAVLGLFGPVYVPILAKAFSGKQECPKKGHAAPDSSPAAPPQNAKSFFRKTRTHDFGTVINDNVMITIW